VGERGLAARRGRLVLVAGGGAGESLLAFDAKTGAVV
jgi:hypothetical protein